MGELLWSPQIQFGNGTRFDSATYVVRITEPHLTPFWQQCCEEYSWVKVVEDSAPGHKYAIQYRDIDTL